MSAGLTCVRCGAALRKVTLRRVEVDECPDCHGTWLDARELASLIGSWQDLPRAGPAAAGGPVCLCPRCNCAMERRNYSESRRTVLDRCPTCSGIWLDRGELDSILSEIYGG